MAKNRLGHGVNLKWREASDAIWRQGENNVERIFVANVAANIDFFDFCNGIDRLGTQGGGPLAFMRVGF